MGNLKQRFIKPGTEFNYAEGVKVLAAEAVYQDQIVYVSGSSGPFLKASRADANLAAGTDGRMMVAKHDIPSGGYGVCLPWKLVKDFDTSAAAAVGDRVYLSETPGTTRASNVTITCPTGSRQVIVGRITVDATAANGGAMLLNPSAPEENVEGGLVTTGTTTVARPVEQYVWALSAGTTTITTKYPVIVTGVKVIQGGASAITQVDVYTGAASGGNEIASIDTSFAGTDGAVLSAEFMYDGKLSVASGGVIRCVRAGGQVEDVIVVTLIRA